MRQDSFAASPLCCNTCDAIKSSFAFMNWKPVASNFKSNGWPQCYNASMPMTHFNTSGITTASASASASAFKVSYKDPINIRDTTKSRWEVGRTIVPLKELGITDEAGNITTTVSTVGISMSCLILMMGAAIVLNRFKFTHLRQGYIELTEQMALVAIEEENRGRLIGSTV